MKRIFEELISIVCVVLFFILVFPALICMVVAVALDESLEHTFVSKAFQKTMSSLASSLK